METKVSQTKWVGILLQLYGSGGGMQIVPWQFNLRLKVVGDLG